jgi:hypothetical protein
MEEKKQALILDRLGAIHNEVTNLMDILNGKHDRVFKEFPAVVEMDLDLPADEIDGLRFNRQTVHAIFEKDEDGWYHSKEILFLSARNTEDDNSNDILSKYLTKAPSEYSDGRSITSQIATAMERILGKPISSFDITVKLPEENQGIKQYNGVDWWYWLSTPIASSAADFAAVSGYGHTSNYYASAVGGCAPAFRVA